MEVLEFEEMQLPTIIQRDLLKAQGCQVGLLWLLFDTQQLSWG